MASYTSNFNLALPAVLSAEDANVWGQLVNGNTSGLDGFLTGITGCFAGSSAPVLGTTLNATIGQLWLNTAAIPTCPLSVYTGTTWVLIGTLNTVSNTFTVPSTSVFTVNQVVFTSSGTYTPSAGLAQAVIEVVGGGGGGGWSNPNAGPASGGGGGGYSRVTLSSGTIGASQTVTVGSGGAGGAGTGMNGASGVTTTFGALASATGGSGGIAGTRNSQPYISLPITSAGGIGTTAGLNVLNLPGQPSSIQAGQNLAAISTPGGGGIYGSGAGAAVAVYGNNVVSNGANGVVNTGGGGAGGAVYGIPGTGATGGNGGSGIVIITEYIG